MILYLLRGSSFNETACVQDGSLTAFHELGADIHHVHRFAIGRAASDNPCANRRAHHGPRGACPDGRTRLHKHSSIQAQRAASVSFSTRLSLALPAASESDVPGVVVARHWLPDRIWPLGGWASASAGAPQSLPLTWSEPAYSGPGC